MTSFPKGKIELPGMKAPAKGKGKNVKPAVSANATILRFPVLGTRAVIGEPIPFKQLQSKNMTGWMEQLWAVGGFRHLFEGICDLRASELGCGGQNDGIAFPERRWHMNIYTLERTNYENTNVFLEDVFGWISWRWIYLGTGAALIAIIIYTMKPFLVDRKTPGRLAKMKSMTFLEADIARVQQEAKLVGR
jgi:hypothetical protein